MDIQINKSTDGVSPGVQHNGPCTVYVDGPLGSATIAIETSLDESSGYALADNFMGGDEGQSKAVFRAPGRIQLVNDGSYWIRSVQSGSTSATSASVRTSQ